MVRDGLQAEDDNNPISPFRDHSTCGDDSHLIDDGSSVGSGNRSRARQWGINRAYSLLFRRAILTSSIHETQNKLLLQMLQITSPAM